MTVFFDDFERANGTPGNGWVNLAGVATISGGTLSGGSYFLAYNTNTSWSGRLEAKCHVLQNNTGIYHLGPVVKAPTSGTGGFCLAVQGSAAPFTLNINYGADIGGSHLATVTLATPPPPYYELKLVWELGHLSGYLDGVLLVEADSGYYATNSYCGICGYFSYGVANDFTATLGTPPVFSVEPVVIGNYGACSTVTFTGTGTAWTAGTPGSPTFTVDHGTLSAQTVLSSTSATATYCPGTYLGPAVFMDPTTGATATAMVTSDPTVVAPTGVALTQDIVDYLARSAAAEPLSTIVNRNEAVDFYAGTKTISETIETIHGTLADPTFASGGQAGILPLVIQVFDLLNGGNDWGGAATVFGNTSLIKTGVDSLSTALSDLQGPGGVSLAVLAAALADLRGTGSPSLADVLAAASGGDSSAVLAAIAAVRGAGSPDLRTLADLAEGMRTVHGYDLASVKSWIDALPQQQSGPTALLILATVAALALAIPSGGASIAAEAVAIGAGPLLDLTTLVEVASLIGTLTGVASDVASIRSSLTTPVNLTPPIWPGLDHATVGASVAIADGLQVAGPLDGLLIHLTTVPAKAGRYAFGDLSSWKYVGAVVFKSDRGDWEWNHPIGLDSQIVTPKAMTHAAAARLRINGGFEGTVRPFTVTA